MSDATSALRWLQISDIHVGKDSYAQRKIFRHILDHVRDTVKTGFRPDLLFVTGDLANKGQPPEYEVFANELMLPLIEAIGNGCEHRTFAIPGNHDVDRGKHQFFSREEMVTPQSRFFDPTDEGRRLREQMFPRLSAYADADWSAAPRHWILTDRGAFAQVLELHGRKLGIVGINTAWLCKDDHDRHKLTPGRGLVEAALNSLPACDAKIVLGHHPLDWYLDHELQAFRALFGKHHVIYLHGHLHEARGVPESSSGKPFLAIQCGAAFQAREDEIWKNGIIWGELDFDLQQLRVQPRHWQAENHDWPVTTGAFPEVRKSTVPEWWAFALPGSEPAPAESPSPTKSKPAPKIPDGWTLLTPQGLASSATPLDRHTAINFFNGAVPTWRLAISESIPRRSVVHGIAAHFLDPQLSDKSRLLVLLGASGEGKSTILYQAIYEILKSNSEWKALRRSDETRALPLPELAAIVGKSGPWLIVTDEADQVAADLFRLVGDLPDKQRSNVHVLMSCRDTDWIASNAVLAQKPGGAAYREERIRGLTKDDADRIVRAWASFGDSGLGKLSGLAHNDAVKKLMEASTQQAAASSGAFLGAMLTVRFGADLRQHVATLVQRLSARPLAGGASLQDALAYIAAMHSQGLEFLSRPVLAKVLDCPGRLLRRDVLMPLGEEAAATTTSQFIFTRHRVIADAVIEVLADSFSFEIDDLFVDLAAAAMDAFLSGEYVPALDQWEYRLPQYFIERKRIELAVRISRKIWERGSHNIRHLVNLAKVLREAGNPDQGAQLFRDYDGEVKNDRAFYYEWATAESKTDNPALAVWLSAIALADDTASFPPDNATAMKVLTGLAGTLADLYRKHHDRLFIEGRSAVGDLVRHLDLDEWHDRYFQQCRAECRTQAVPAVELEQGIQRLMAAIRKAASFCDASISKISLPAADSLIWNGLTRLLTNAATRKSIRSR